MLDFHVARTYLALIFFTTSLRLQVWSAEVPTKAVASCIDEYVEGRRAYEDDEAVLSPIAEEVLGLDLLQVDIRVQSNSVASASSATPALDASSKLASQIDANPANARLDQTEAHRHRHSTVVLLKVQRLVSSMSQTIGTSLPVTLGWLSVALIGLCVAACLGLSVEPPPKGASSPGLPQRANTGSPQPVSLAINSPQRQITSPSTTTGLLVPICPALVLKDSKATFMIPIASLQGGVGKIDILGPSGKKVLLQCSRSELDDGRRRLAIASLGCWQDPRAVVVGPPPFAPSKTLEVQGKGGYPYGTMEPGSVGGYVLKRDGRPVMSIECGLDLKMTASSMGGMLLASASKNSAGKDEWVLKVEENNDAVLISACMLALMFFNQ